MVSLINFSRFLNIGMQTCSKKVDSNFLIKQPSIMCQTLLIAGIRNYRKIKGVPRSIPWIDKKPDYQTEVINTTKEDAKIAADVCEQINEQIAENKTGRLFAIIHLAGKQHKITESDLVVVRGYWPPQPGDKIKLEKVLLVGGTDFSLIGRPILNRELVSINATVIDKTFSQTITHFRFRKRKQYRRIHFFRIPQTMIRINAITLNGKVNRKLEVEGLDRVY
ncbi:PREDICTED: 39S ribosomal protein L21, mitochondrial [Ceratosolen solmsi marchali]|uniref:Large ribosomal subunit protein bL21m n=1 Tax=Ceratosolen solmsi marchali TaxID=326594 RepID=A0AAJ6YHU8_9HYME|nr:PREDICTED: 39S ribosomal protein L21, mitochondrial [Ceratosolen solmsi marchali]